MAPSTATIRSLLEKTPGNIAAKRSNPGSLFQLGGLEEILAPNVKVEIPGFAVTVTGAEAIKSLSPHPEFPALASIIRLDQPLTSTVTHVVGGGSDDIIVAITSSKATTHSGKPWDHESVLVLHFNNQDQIDSLKAYIDTKSISEHIEASAA